MKSKTLLSLFVLATPILAAAQTLSAFEQLAVESGRPIQAPVARPAMAAPQKPLKGRLERRCGTGAQGCIDVLYLHGTPYEMGYAHGVLLRDKVRKSLSDLDAGLFEMLPEEARKTNADSKSGKISLLHDVLDIAWSRLAPQVSPEKMEEMRGLADGAGVPLAALQRFHAFPDVGETSCSGMVAQPAATSDAHVYQLRILDYFSKLKIYEQPALLVYKPEHGRKYVNIGWAGFIGVVSGINDARVGISEMGGLPGPGERLDGEPMPFVLEDVLRAAGNADDAAAVVRAAKGTNRYVFMFGDPTGRAVGMIASADGAYQWRANEVAALKVDGKEYRQVRDSVFAGHFHDRQYEWTAKHVGSINFNSLQDLARQIRMESNFQTVIYDLTAGVLLIANRQGDTPASDTAYSRFDLAPLWAGVDALP